ncbi:type II toxin-antitoxin system ParD family antitoxin [Rhizobium sp. LjRoot30]|uniref:type II toxin-antitoxin system ParD family antitoxin n=1 Tax=Rhizobium sp. LjRoot30 TaxID=3342320 RepID=UPI003ED023EC
MGKVTSVAIDDEMGAFIVEQIDQGRFRSAEDVVDAALQLLRREAEIEAIRAAIIEGEESGEPVEFDFDAFVEKKRASRRSQ